MYHAQRCHVVRNSPSPKHRAPWQNKWLSKHTTTDPPSTPHPPPICTSIALARLCLVHSGTKARTASSLACFYQSPSTEVSQARVISFLRHATYQTQSGVGDCKWWPVAMFAEHSCLLGEVASYVAQDDRALRRTGLRLWNYRSTLMVPSVIGS